MNSIIPNYAQLIEFTFKALKDLGGSGKNDEINNKVAVLMQLDDDVLDKPHLGSSSISEVDYRCAWARTLLKNYGAIENSARSVWSITPAFTSTDSVNGEYIDKNCRNKGLGKKNASKIIVNEIIEDVPEEELPWRKKLSEILQNMDPYAFERLTQRLLRECGFSDVIVTAKSGDGGIDGYGKLKINGILSFNIAFQCKRYHGAVGSPEIRNFRGSLDSSIEKGIFITTGTFTKAAKEEACISSKKQIDLIDGEEFIDKLAELGLGVSEIKIFEINESFFTSL